MQSPYAYVVAARLGLSVIAPLAITAAMLVPAAATSAEVIAFATATLMLLQAAHMAMPLRRKSEIATAVLVVGSAVAVLRSSSLGEPRLLASAFAVAASVAAALLVLATEQMRATVRRYGNTRFSVILIEEERRERRVASRASGSMQDQPGQAARA